MHLMDIKDYNYFSNSVYNVDPKKGSKYHVKRVINDKHVTQPYKILDISRNGTYGPYQKYGAKNGMQTMAVVPVNKSRL